MENPSRIARLQPHRNLWHELKEYIRREVKPSCKEDLVEGIYKFWETVTTEKCQKYIRHLRKVLPKIIEVGGGGGYWLLMGLQSGESSGGFHCLILSNV